MAQKFRVFPRHFLRHPFPVTLYSSELKRVEGMLVDVSEEGMGILINRPMEPLGRCTLEIVYDAKAKSFEGTVSYVTRTEYGLRLGMHLEPGSDSIINYLEELQVEFE
ncbi:PilZ domain-containing protein [Gallaecimonas kandeliae]|uniref:PilZ domain-containing protein n=1 Tax=Gallaecimonas kandeliae TaxID=3029055 RepID=UPI0026488363|nr:PilZ domain-containing protein [Gallaecimonas kandeliae]WKE64589.1 PilZ domain-containing protein [Gallaecimonas kandeliae]